MVHGPLKESGNDTSITESQLFTIASAKTTLLNHVVLYKFWAKSKFDPLGSFYKVYQTHHHVTEKLVSVMNWPIYKNEDQSNKFCSGSG